MNILTIDLEEWYTYELYPKGGKAYFLPIINKYLDDILALLDARQTKATFFCLGIIAREYPEIIRKIANRGHEIGCHSDKHILLSKMSPREFRKDTSEAIDSLQQVTGQKIEYYRAPAFSISEKNKWTLDILIEQGITTDCSIFGSKHSFGGFPGFPEKTPSIIKINNQTIKEFPMTSATYLGKQLMYTGGGYFRLLPYSIIKNLMNSSGYNMAYFHIRDFDSKQKHVYSWRYFHSYYGIREAFNKFNKFVQDFNFIPLGRAIQQVKWDAVKTIDFD